MLSKQILHKIKMARLSNNWSQKKIATLLHISVPTYSRFERGITKTDYTLLQKVCAFLKIDLQTTESLNIEPALNFVEEEKSTYTSKYKKLSVSYSDVQKLIGLFEQQQQLNKKILTQLKIIQLQD